MSSNSTTRFDKRGESAQPSHSNNNYPVSPAKIGNQDGYRLPRAFSRDHPELVGASGHVEVLDENTLLVRLNPLKKTKSERDDVMMSLFGSVAKRRDKGKRVKKEVKIL
jgi:hypothetical protein